MAPPPTTSSSSTELKAAYKSPSGDKNFAHTLTITSALDKTTENEHRGQFTEAKTAYLFNLRSATKQMQAEINAFLTTKMDEDKKNATTSDKGKDEVEEEKYGEEEVDEDE